MNILADNAMDNLLKRYPALDCCSQDIKKALELMIQMITDSINETGSYRVKDLVEKYS